MTDKTPVKKPVQGKTIPALVVSTARGISRFRRAGFGFNETGTIIPLDTLSDDQAKALRNDPALIAKEADISPEDAAMLLGDKTPNGDA
ncbi:hypothetical protein [Oceanobacter sp. 4_MG-2023]|uniref:hypothetical protein n=1 Tax=Oceanobacter sp. 4_MG-2023 TaxID=3062623 RepID=UPI0027341987|nr:hypothetical protein [Oceanobacter sp. 4_MG-2023]MDP2548082.1 hypothetical protein [Oceanobacter sp. 4_MG-2023]